MSHAPSDVLAARHRTVRESFREHQLEALVVTSLPNVLYLTNFTGSTAIVVLTADRLTFLTDSRYITAVSDTRGTAQECPGLQLTNVEGSYDATLARLLLAMGSSRIGFEATNLTYSRHAWLSKTLAPGPKAPELVPTEGLLERARARKDGYERSILREAASRLSRVAAAIVSEVRRGRTERDIARAIDLRIIEAGFEKPAFETIVASGPNAALPHAHPTERKLTEGDLVVLDFGGVYDSYCVDLTRTVVIGPATPRVRQVYTAVLNAHDAAIRAVAPGVSRFAIDEAARSTLATAGMAEAFGHGTGHGLGVEIHEDPRIAKRRPDDDPAAGAVSEDMVFTIEPGAYFPGWGGVRIEDDVVVTASGVAVLTDVSTELIEL
jgi:Xaa-Pro aminopeptidase